MCLKRNYKIFAEYNWKLWLFLTIAFLQTLQFRCMWQQFLQDILIAFQTILYYNPSLFIANNQECESQKFWQNHSHIAIITAKNMIKDYILTKLLFNNFLKFLDSNIQSQTIGQWPQSEKFSMSVTIKWLMIKYKYVIIIFRWFNAYDGFGH